MRLITKQSLFILVVAIIALPAVVFSAPDPGGEARIGSYNTQQPSPRVTSNVSFPYPSNKWFTTIYSKHPNDNWPRPDPVEDNKFSYKMSPRPLMINFNAKTQAAAADNGYGYVMGYESIIGNTSDTVSNFGLNNPWISRYFMRVAARTLGGQHIIATQSVLDKASDWAVTALIDDSSGNGSIKTTTGSGFLFTYNQYAGDIVPYFESLIGNNFSYYAKDSVTPETVSYTGDCIMIRGLEVASGRITYFGIYAPGNSLFTLGSGTLTVAFDTNTVTDKYVSVGLIASYPSASDNVAEAAAIFSDYYKYAYNFISDTKVDYAFDKNTGKVTTTFNFTFDSKKPELASNGTVVAVFPHQWNNMPLTAYKTAEFRTLRGNMKVLSAAPSFQTVMQFKGIMPALTYEIHDADSRNNLQSYANTDYNTLNLINTAGTGGGDVVNNTYVKGKALARAADLLPIFHQLGGADNINKRNGIIEKLKTELKIWYTYNGQAEKYFGYDSVWGGLMGFPVGFGLEDYNDHHFHFGYFVYASAILSMFDPEFASSSQYKGMVDLIVNDMNNPPVNKFGIHNSNFPVLRCLDVYEGHSWASGPGGGNDNGIDQESSSEAMNAWAGIYLWGLATDNQQMMDLGAYGYTTEYESIKEYYFDMSGTVYGTPYNNYDFSSVGILYANVYVHNILFDPRISQTIKGIQILPMNPAALYHGYNKTYAQKFYEEMYARRDTGTYANLWKDIWLKYKALFDAPAALTEFENGSFSAEAGNSKTASYQFIHFFNSLGTINTDYYADSASYAVLDKSGAKTFIAFNNSNFAHKTVSFKNVPSGINYDSIKVPPMTMASTKDFIDFKYDSLRAMYAEGNNYALILDKYTDKVTVTPAVVEQIDERYYKTIPFVFTVEAASETLGNLASYVYLSSVSIPSGYSASDIKVALYNPSRNLPDRVFPSQDPPIVESESGGYATLLIKSTFTKTGTYVLVIPTGITPSGSTLLSGTLKQEQDGSDVSATMSIYDVVKKSTDTKDFTGTYSFEVFEGDSYVVTPYSAGFAFSPKSYSFTVTSDQNITQNFSACKLYTLSGQIMLNAKALDKINVYVYDFGSGSTSTVITANGGIYTGEIAHGRNYVITPVSDDYDFTPATLMLNSVNSSASGMNFYARIADGKFVVYPNPYKPSKHGNSGIIFNGLKSGAEIKIYNIAGELVFETKTIVDGAYVWDSGNNAGNQAASGVYIYYVKSDGKTRKGKFAIER